MLIAFCAINSFSAETDEFSIYNTVNSFLEKSKQSLQENDGLSKDIGTYVLEISRKNNYKVGEIKALHILGTYYKKQSAYKEALQHQFDALKLAVSINHQEHISESYYQIADIYKALSNYKKGSEYFSKSASICFQLKDTLMTIRSLNKLGHINMDQIGTDTLRNEVYFNTGLNYYNEAFNLAKEFNNQEAIISSYLNIGNAYLAIGNVTSDIVYLNKSIDASNMGLVANKETGDKVIEGILLLNISEAYENLKHFKKANSILNKAIEQFSNPEKVGYLWMCYLRKGEIYAQLGNYHKAIEFQLQAYELNKKENLLYALKRNSKHLSNYYSKIGDNYNAYKYQLLNAEYTKEIYDNQSDLNVAKLQIAYDTETKDKEIALLQKNKELQDTKLEQEATIRYVLIISSFLLSICLFLVIRQNFLRKRQGRLIEEKNTELEKLSIVASKTLNAVIITNFAGEIEWVNEGFTKLYGWEGKATLFEEYGSNIFGMSCFNTVLPKIEEAIANKASMIFESLHTTKNKGQRTIQSAFTPIFDETGELKKMVFVDTDVTDLNEAKITAERALQIQEQFIANTSHEIRTPMNGVLGMLRKLEGSSLDAEQEEIVKAILDSSNNLMYVVNDILDISKIKAGKIIFEKVPFKIKEIVQSISNNLRFRAEDKQIEFAINLDESADIVIEGDPLRLNQVLLNLCGNAIKFTDNGSVAIDISCVSDSSDSIKYSFEISDTGIGIAGDKLAAIFDHFTQAEQHISSKYGGTGLGLSISKYLVEIQGGHISVNSEIGKGSTFKFELLFEKSSQKVLDETLTEADTNIDLSLLRVLVVDDIKINQKVAEYELSNWDIKPDIADNAEDALQLITENTYDVVLMDIAMPGMDGLEATRVIRNELKLTEDQLPVIAMTASALIGDKDKCLQAGMNDFISKPFDPKDLYRKLLYWCKNIKTEKVLKPEIATPNDAILDLKMVMDRADGDYNYINDMIELFQKEIPVYVTELTLFKHEKKWPEVFKQVHKMKSPVAYFGCHEFLGLLKGIEVLKHEEQLNETALLKELELVHPQVNIIMELLDQELQNIRQKAGVLVTAD